MGFSSSATAKKHHAVCIPFPTQGHITPMMMLAKILHSRDSTLHSSTLSTTTAASSSPAARPPSTATPTFDSRLSPTVSPHPVSTAPRTSLPSASGIILNTFGSLESSVLKTMERILPPMYSIGPLPLLSQQLTKSPLVAVASNLWKEDTSCLEWLQGRKPGSVVYVNFGSTATITTGSYNKDFLWIIRPDLVKGDSAVLPEDFLRETQDRGLLSGWCPQEKVLGHPALGGFLTHSGWNSTLESISSGVPMLCWPFFADQPTNCCFVCGEWGIGMEIDGDVRREEIQSLVAELMDGEKGNEMRRRAREWKERALDATKPSGTSSMNLDELVRKLSTAATGFA
ncbi:unnamed protein product [Spirodela intermedia]|uniref:Uncharacterized protein n=1 Tax=Spirodela intermedia TaxID=51605 RepID=A0A7I8ILX1_SPIIN|nr:unnamed protein product [Spirodela intermedia]CAA6658835.1 unnamed protein product [Spirodela intermedia]